MGDQPGRHAVSGDVVVDQQVKIFGWATNLVDMLNAAVAQTTTVDVAHPLSSSNLPRVPPPRVS